MHENQQEQPGATVSPEGVRQMLLLAERLREQHGGELDDAAILAVSEMSGLSPEYVRVTVGRLSDQKQGVFQRARTQVLTLEPDVRRHVLSGLIATACALFEALSDKIPVAINIGQSLFGALFLIMVGVGVWNVSVSKDSKVAAISGAFFGGIYFVAQALFIFLIQLALRGMELQGIHAPSSPNSILLIPYVIGGGLLGLFAQKIVRRVQSRFGIRDPAQERQELLRQLVQLQDKLRLGEQSMTFVSFDIVGSTKLKARADPLSVEFTFSEYHNFVETVAKRYGGRVHSTAGDGVICAFEHPQPAFGAARNVQAGIVELNTYRNKLGAPLVLRAGIHSGAVNAPTPGDITSLNFAHVIDVAAHVQHACPPGGVAVSEEAAKLLPMGPSSVGPTRIVTDDCIAYIWEPKQKLVQLDPATPPPAPR